MSYHRMLILPTRDALDRFWRDLVSLDDATFEIEYILAKLFELIDEARSCRGESPSSPTWEAAFAQAVLYEGIGDYHSPHETLLFKRALSELYRRCLSVLIAHDGQFHPDEGIVYLRHIKGDVILGLYDVTRLSANHR